MACTFILIGFSLLLGEDMVGLIGKPGFDIFTSYADFDWSNFVFNLVFCATTATIVRSHGRKNKILILLYLLRCNLTDLSDRSTLDLGAAAGWPRWDSTILQDPVRSIW